jgi:hypothetical protein
MGNTLFQTRPNWTSSGRPIRTPRSLKTNQPSMRIAISPEEPALPAPACRGSLSGGDG